MHWKTVLNVYTCIRFGFLMHIECVNQIHIWFKLGLFISLFHISNRINKYIFRNRSESKNSYIYIDTTEINVNEDKFNRNVFDRKSMKEEEKKQKTNEPSWITDILAKIIIIIIKKQPTKSLILKWKSKCISLNGKATTIYYFICAERGLSLIWNDTIIPCVPNGSSHE